MASFFYPLGLKECLNGTIVLGTTTLKLILVDSSYTPSKDDTVVSTGTTGDAESAEIDVTNYTRGWGNAGRKTATITMGVFSEGATYRVDVAIADVVWTALGTGVNIAGAILIKEGTADDTTSRLIMYFDVTDTPTNGGDILLDFVALVDGGNIRFSV